MALQSASPFRWQVEEIHHLVAHPVGHEPIPFSLRGWRAVAQHPGRCLRRDSLIAKDEDPFEWPCPSPRRRECCLLGCVQPFGDRRGSLYGSVMEAVSKCPSVQVTAQAEANGLFRACRD
jgi:hypothetical protein